MKTCTFENCDRKHHAKGYCKLHYKKLVVAELMKERVCDVTGCTKPVRQGRLCSMHESRLIRHGNVNDRTRAREIASILNTLKDCKDPFSFEMPNRNTWAHIAKIVYGHKCFRCGWDQGNCDVHHKVYHRNGGVNTLNNAEVICPNCHRLEHQKTSNYYSEETKELIRGYFRPLGDSKPH